MLIIRFFHNEEELQVNGTTYKATCKVKNEINKERSKTQVVNSLPLSGDVTPYYPRKFPTGLWEVKKPVWTDDPMFWPVKIPTNAKRPCMTWNVKHKKYDSPTGEYQNDAYYHIHYSKNYRTTLGCIRANSKEDAGEIAKLVEWYFEKNQKVYLEVMISKEL